MSGLWDLFTVSTNLRGLEVAVDVARLLSYGGPGLRHRRCLDVGCGAGGTVVGLARLGADGWGIEIDPTRLELAEANAADNGVTVHLEHGDLLDEQLRRRLGRFDAVSGEDVLEHVADARAGVAALADLVADGGLVRTTIPNGDAVAFVQADGHYLLPGLTLLEDRRLAEAYHSVRLPWDVYEVGAYHGLDEYRRWFAESGMTVLGVEGIEVSSWHDLEAELATAGARIDEAANDEDLPDTVRAGLRRGWERYLERVTAARELPRPEAERRLTARFWRITASRGRLRRRPSLGTPVGWLTLAKRFPGLRPVVRGARRRFGRP